ncbi:MAG: hypothetical protein QM695_07345 [Micropruina sp.]
MLFLVHIPSVRKELDGPVRCPAPRELNNDDGDLDRQAITEVQWSSSSAVVDCGQRTPGTGGMRRATRVEFLTRPMFS